MTANDKVQNGPVMDGAEDDFSDSGTSKTEAQDLGEAGRGDEVVPPDALGIGGIGDDPLHNSKDAS